MPASLRGIITTALSMFFRGKKFSISIKDISTDWNLYKGLHSNKIFWHF
jgi:hypothetical protein